MFTNFFLPSQVVSTLLACQLKALAYMIRSESREMVQNEEVVLAVASHPLNSNQTINR